MKRLVNALVTIAFATSFLGNSAFGLEGYVQSEEEAKGTKLLVLGEELSALGCGVLMGLGTFGLTYALLSGLTEDSDVGSDIALYGGLAAGYGLGFPLGSAIGANIVGEQTNQGGSLWSSWAGAGIGALCAPSLALLLGMIAGSEELAVLALALGAPTGAVIGYNRGRPKAIQIPGNAFQHSSAGAGPQFSLLVPEVELRRDRFANSFRPRLRRDPTLTYKVTLARLSF